MASLEGKKSKWITELFIAFVPLPPEKEAAYWAAIRILGEIMFADLIGPEKEAEVKNTIDEQ